jgi:hypothetical protein
MKSKSRSVPQPDEHRYRRQHDPVEPVSDRADTLDTEGNYGNPYRTIGLLAAMERNKRIEPGMRAAGDRFHALFMRACLEPLHAADMGRVGGGGEVAVIRGNQKAKDAVYAALNALGGEDTLAGCCARFVLGHEDSLTAWAQRERGKGRNISTENASGILIGLLPVLQKQFGC